MEMTFETVRPRSEITIKIGGKDVILAANISYHVTKTTMTAENGDMAISEVVARDSSTFEPLTSYKRVKDAKTDYEVWNNYEGNRCNFTLIINGGEPVTGSLKTGNNLTYDNEMILMVLRCAPLASSFSFSFRVPSAHNNAIERVAVKTASPSTGKIKVLGHEDIEVFNLNIALDQRLSGVPVKVVFAAALPGRLYDYRNVLVEMIQGDTAYRLTSASQS
jgi:hypothetical protein